MFNNDVHMVMSTQDTQLMGCQEKNPTIKTGSSIDSNYGGYDSNR